MAFLDDRDRSEIQARLTGLTGLVRLVNFTQELAGQSCRETERLLQEVTALSDKISLEVYNFQFDKTKVTQYRVDKIPAIVVAGPKDFGVRFYGTPLGYEFATFLAAIQDVSRGGTDLKPETRAAIAEIGQPVHLQVFTTPTWPHCPAAVRLAQQMAVENDLITADMVEVTEFPQLAQRYRVRAVPRTVVNDTGSIEGTLPEAEFVEAIIAAARQKWAAF